MELNEPKNINLFIFYEGRGHNLVGYMKGWDHSCAGLRI